jgi:hypothetical protein
VSDAGRGANDEEHAASEKGECAFRNAVIGGRKMTLWVINCRADSQEARLFYPCT